MLPAPLFEHFDDFAHLLGAPPIGHQQGVRRVHNYQIVHAKERDELFTAIDIIASGLPGENLR